MAVDMFLKIDNIKGESTDDRHKDWIEIESFSWGLSNTASVGHGGGGGAGKVNVHDISFVRPVDAASPVLFQACCRGEHLREATLTVRKAGSKQDYLKYKLTDILISSYQTGGSSGDLPLEEVSLNFNKVHVEYFNESTNEGAKAECSTRGGRSR